MNAHKSFNKLEKLLEKVKISQVVKGLLPEQRFNNIVIMCERIVAPTILPSIVSTILFSIVSTISFSIVSTISFSIVSTISFSIVSTISFSIVLTILFTVASTILFSNDEVTMLFMVVGTEPKICHCFLTTCLCSWHIYQFQLVNKLLQKLVNDWTIML